MKSIFKYPLPATPKEFSFSLPVGAVILSVQTQNGAPTMWALVDDEATEETRRFIMFGTGWPIQLETERLRFIGTVQVPGGLVWHYFELAP